MWHGLFHVLGRVAGLVARSGVLVPGRGRDQGQGARGAKHGRGKNDLLANLTDDRLVGAALAGAAETVRAMLSRPSVRASLEAAVLRLPGGTGPQCQPVEALRESANTIALILEERGAAPNRLGVDGLPGSGKSSLARALADRLGLQWKSLDHENMNFPKDLTQEHTVYEHHRLLRTQDLDVFDAIIYIDEAVRISKARVLQRARREARGGMITDVLEYEKLKKIGKLAFDVCQGEPILIPGSSLVMKIRPPQGFRAAENIASRLQTAGHDAQGLGKEEMLFLLVYGKPRSGLMAYFLPGAYNAELLRGLLAGTRRYLAE